MTRFGCQQGPGVTPTGDKQVKAPQAETGKNLLFLCGKQGFTAIESPLLEWFSQKLSDANTNPVVIH